MVRLEHFELVKSKNKALVLPRKREVEQENKSHTTKFRERWPENYLIFCLKIPKIYPKVN